LKLTSDPDPGGGVRGRRRATGLGNREDGFGYRSPGKTYGHDGVRVGLRRWRLLGERDRPGVVSGPRPPAGVRARCHDVDAYPAGDGSQLGVGISFGAQQRGIIAPIRRGGRGIEVAQRSG